LDDQKKPFTVDIDLQKDFGSNAKAALADKFKKYLGDPAVTESLKNIPLKPIRHKESPYIIAPLDMSGSMGGYGLHEIPHKESLKNIWDKELLSNKFNDKKIIIFDEMDKLADDDIVKKMRELIDTLGPLNIHFVAPESRAEGTVLAESFQQGAAQPVAVRRPFSLRAQASTP
jgi:hypothetical protein